METEIPIRARLRANAFTRLLYAVALAGMVMRWITPSSGWIGLALGSIGVVSATMSAVFFALAAAVLYRIYTVARYASALDARDPWWFGWLLRWLGLLAMAVGAAATVGLFFVRPLTMLVFKSAGDNGIGFFVVGLYATVLAGLGPYGCLLFEISRVCGAKPAEPPPGRAAPQRRQDYAVIGLLGVMAAAMVALPWMRQAAKGPVSGGYVGGQCIAPVVLDCAGKTIAVTARMVGVSAGGAVRLQSTIDGIEYHDPGLKPGMALIESPEEVVARAGWRVAPDAEVALDIDVRDGGESPVLVIRVADKSGEAARFTTTFAGGAKLQAMPSGARRIVVDLGREVMLPLMPAPGPDQKVHLLDGMYAHLRQAVGSEREAAVASAALPRSAAARSSDAPPDNFKVSEKPVQPDCAGVVDFRTQTAPEMGSPPYTFSLHEVAFAASGQTALFNNGDSVSCHGGAVWMARFDHLAHVLHVRRYDALGQLQRAWRVSIPAGGPETSHFPEVETIEESGGEVRVRMKVTEGFARPKSQLTWFVFPA